MKHRSGLPNDFLIRFNAAKSELQNMLKKSPGAALQLHHLDNPSSERELFSIYPVLECVLSIVAYNNTQAVII